MTIFTMFKLWEKNSTGRLMHRDHMLYTCSGMRFDFKKERKLAICDQMDKGGVLLL